MGHHGERLIPMPDTTGLCDKAVARVTQNVDALNVVAESARQVCRDDLYSEVRAALSGLVYV